MGFTLLLALGGSLVGQPGWAQPSLAAGDAVVEARAAYGKRDRARLASLRATVMARSHPLAGWVDYWELSNRLDEAQVDEVEAFYARNVGTYVEDRLRNDWLLELGRRRDWANLARDFARFRMNDDREVTCYALLAEYRSGKDVRAAAREAWFAQREADDGCSLLASTLAAAKVFSVDDLWLRARLAVEQNRPRVAKLATSLINAPATRASVELLDDPVRYLHRQTRSSTRTESELALLAVVRAAASDTGFSASQLGEHWQDLLSGERAAWAWSQVGRQAALRLQPDAFMHYERAWSMLRKIEAGRPGWSDDTLAWGVRSALRAPPTRERWALVAQMIDAMTPREQREPDWTYWKARALLGSADVGPEGESQREEGRQLLAAVASPTHFYGQLATEDLGQPLALPPAPEPPSAVDREAARSHSGLNRALQMAAVGLRDEAHREWNFSLRGMSDRELRAAAQVACDAKDWQLCINTAERTRAEVDVALRYPTPFADEISNAAESAGLDPAYVFGLIRQETRFNANLRSWAGASGLMQLMPATARWTAKKIGLDFRVDQIYDLPINLKLGTRYLKMVLDDLGNSQPMAAAAYNAGPSRTRRWRDGPVVDSAVWAENIPINETRRYVKKVLANAAVYTVLLSRPQASLKSRLGAAIGPRAFSAPPVNKELP
jgi:soluble lytic murein transglycosylase